VGEGKWMNCLHDVYTRSIVGKVLWCVRIPKTEANLVEHSWESIIAGDLADFASAGGIRGNKVEFESKGFRSTEFKGSPFVKWESRFKSYFDKLLFITSVKQTHEIHS